MALLSHKAVIIGASLWCLSILSAPILQIEPVYAFFSRICHQDPARTWHVFGQPLAVCVRCAAIYVGFLGGILLYLPANARRLKIAIGATAAELVVARFLLDHAALRSITGLFLGAMAAPFIPMGINQMLQRLRNDSM
jgi:uncharacterized membrane protein